MNTTYAVAKIIRPRRGWAVISTTDGVRRMVTGISSTKRDALSSLEEIRKENA